MEDNPDKEKEKHIAEVIAEETARGRGKAPRGMMRKREHLELARALDKAMKARNERAFSDALRRAGIHDGSEVWKNAWAAYRAYWNP